ncbi:hypothetical protein [Actinoplanes aureus]|uniref:Uncharacterized protein n=1 Tax=Actinoplanes aureus TaxID=2792083 RepID=A0A931CJW8_9ACTN|nr:hypothetical protein [Actinoplanes aureus]MBG0567543.1 hypothetical protein [Actinoplanes aureus]
MTESPLNLLAAAALIDAGIALAAAPTASPQTHYDAAYAVFVNGGELSAAGPHASSGSGHIRSGCRNAQSADIRPITGLEDGAAAVGQAAGAVRDVIVFGGNMPTELGPNMQADQALGIG